VREKQVLWLTLAVLFGAAVALTGVGWLLFVSARDGLFVGLMIVAVGLVGYFLPVPKLPAGMSFKMIFACEVLMTLGCLTLLALLLPPDLQPYFPTMIATFGAFSGSQLLRARNDYLRSGSLTK